MEICGRILTRGNQATIRWVPSHNEVEGNEMSGRYARAAASRSAPYQDNATPTELLGETTLAYMTRAATEARSEATAAWIWDDVRPEHRYRPPLGSGLRRRHLRSERKETAGRFYQFLSGHASIGTYLKSKTQTINNDVLVVRHR